MVSIKFGKLALSRYWQSLNLHVCNNLYWRIFNWLSLPNSSSHQIKNLTKVFHYTVLQPSQLQFTLNVVMVIHLLLCINYATHFIHACMYRNVYAKNSTGVSHMCIGCDGCNYGFFCGHYIMISQRWRESGDRNNRNLITMFDLELKENVAYITLRPTA